MFGEFLLDNGMLIHCPRRKYFDYKEPGNAGAGRGHGDEQADSQVRHLPLRAELRPAPNGQLELEVRGIDTYDPRQNSVRSGTVKDFHCIMTDTEYDGLSFRVRRINFPNQTGDRQLERMKRDLQRHIDDRKWNRLLTAVTIPFDPPESGEVAVKVIDQAGMETMRVISTSQPAI